MSKTKHIIMIFLLALSIFGCSNESKVVKRFGVDVKNFNGLEIPVALKEPLLSTDEIKTINSLDVKKKISTLADLFSYFRSADYDAKDSASFSDWVCEMLFGDYEEAGTIVLNNKTEEYCVLYLKSDGMYYPVDIYAQYKEGKGWMDGYTGQECYFTNKEMMLEEIENSYGNGLYPEKALREYYITAPNTKAYKVECDDENGMKTFVFGASELPVEIGLPQLTEEEILQLNETNASEHINTFADFVAYMGLHSDALEGVNSSLGPAASTALAMDFLVGDYDEVGKVNFHQPNNHYESLYLKVNGKYYLMDAFHRNMYSKTPFTSKEEINDYYVSNDKGSAITETSFVEATFLGFAEAPNGMKLKKEERLGEEVFVYCGVQIPLGTGLPKLTYEEIDTMIETKNYDAIKTKITTLADAVCYFVRAKFRACSNFDEGVDPGNLIFDDESRNFYTVSGKEMLMIKCGQCSSMSTCLHYILDGDYSEFGYISLQYENGGGHVECYLKNEGRYYLFSPAEYTLRIGEDGIFEPFPEHNWNFLYTEEKASADSLDELIQEIILSPNPGSPNEKVKKCYTIVSKGDYCIEQDHASFPDGTEVKGWTKDSLVAYKSFDHDWKSMERFDGFKKQLKNPVLIENAD